MQLKDLRKAIDSIKPNLQKFEGNPFFAVIDQWIQKVDILLKHTHLFEQDLINELLAFKLKYLEIDPKESSDIGVQLEKTKKAVTTFFEQTKFKKSSKKENNTLIKSVQDAIDSVHFCGFEKNQLIFRGQINSDWDIQPSLFREYSILKKASKFEAASIAPTILNIKSPLVHSYDPIENLFVAQHFGLPTRLVDWTNDILVGLFFACYDPLEQQTEKHGRLTLTERAMYKTLKINSKENRGYKEPLDIEGSLARNNRMKIDDIQLIEPLIKNPRMRIQDGCFMFFPWKFESTDNKLLSFNKYIREYNKMVKEHNQSNKQEHSILFVASKEIDKNYKNTILQELDKKHGISADSLFINSKHSNSVENYFEILKKHGEKMANK